MAIKKPEKKEKKTFNRAESIYCKKKFGLDEDIQAFIKSKYKEYKNILQLTRDAFKELSLNENSDEYDNVKNYVARLHKGVEMQNFTEDEINYICDNGESMRPSDLARALFPDKMSNIGEIRSITALLDALEIRFVDETKPEALGEYYPVRTDHKILALINRANPEAKYAINALDSEKKRCIAALKKHMGSSRFIAVANAIRTRQHREIFEEEFVKAVYDKPDLVAEEVGAYIQLAQEYVVSLSAYEMMNLLNDCLKEAAVGTEDEDSRKKYTKTIQESLETKTMEYNQSQTRIDRLRNDMIGKRIDRLKYTVQANESLAKFVELAKTQEGRDYMLRLSAQREQEIEKEVKRISDLSDLVAEIHGISVSEILKF